MNKCCKEHDVVIEEGEEEEEERNHDENEGAFSLYGFSIAFLRVTREINSSNNFEFLHDGDS